MKIGRSLISGRRRDRSHATHSDDSLYVVLIHGLSLNGMIQCRENFQAAAEQSLFGADRRELDKPIQLQPLYLPHRPSNCLKPRLMISVELSSWLSRLPN